MLLSLFKFIFGFVLLGIQFYFYRAVKAYLSEGRPRPRLLLLARILFALFSLPVLVASFWFPLVTRAPALVIFILFYPFYCWHFTWFLMFLLTAAGEVLRLILRGASFLRQMAGGPPRKPVLPYQPSRRTFLRRTSVTTAGVIFSGAAYGALVHDNYELTRITIPLARLPHAFEGYTIALLSDIHSSIFMTRETMDRYVSAANELGANIIAVTGDFVNSMVQEVHPFAESFSRLTAQDGVYGVLGNHDFYTKDVEQVAEVVNQCGIRLIRNQYLTLRRGGESLILAGVDDAEIPPVARNYITRSLAGAPDEPARVLLCHRPYFLREAIDSQVDLMLSGHTHGGQIVLARFGNEVMAPARLASPFVAGLYKRSGTQLYVSRGIGTVGLPIRINCPPELTLITLTRA